MAWVIPPTAVTGNVIPASWGNDVIGDLTILATGIGLLGGNTAIVGSAPATTSPAFSINAGVAGFTASAGAFSFNFPSAFPNGLLAITMQTTDISFDDSIILNTSSTTKATVVGVYNRSGAAYTGAASCTYIAIGF